MDTTAKLNMEMTIQEAIITMSEGNSVALTCLQKMIESNPMAILDILYFDFLGIYGSKIYILWNDCCNRDINKYEFSSSRLHISCVTVLKVGKELAP